MGVPNDAGPGRDAHAGEFLARLGNQVRTRRRASGVTVAALAERSGVSKRSIMLIEQGNANPNLVTVDKLARALGVDFVGSRPPCRPCD